MATPIQHGDEIVGALELYSRHERPWSRFHISRARLIAHQLGPILSRTQPNARPAAAARSAAAHQPR